MLGLVFAAFYVAFAIVVNNTPPIAAIESTLGFLWYWHVVFACIIGIILLIVPIAGLFAAVNEDGKQKVFGAIVMLCSPLIFLLGMMGPALFLGAVYAVDSGIQDGEIVNQTHVIVGGFLYGVGVLNQIVNRVTMKGNQ